MTNAQKTTLAQRRYMAVGFRILASFNRDFYSIALPIIIIGFAAVAQELKYTVTVYFFAFALSQLLCGYYIERYGGRLVLRAALILFVIGTMLCLATTFYWPLMFLGRSLQAIGVACLPVLAKAMLVRKLKSAKDSFFIVRMSQSILKAGIPILTGFLLALVSWQWVFILLFIWTIVYYMIALSLESEIYPAHKKQHKLKLPFALYGQAFTDKLSLSLLMSYSIVNGTASLYTFAAALILTQKLGLDSWSVGLLISTFTFAQLLALAVAKWLRPYVKARMNISIALGASFIGAASMLVSIWMFGENVMGLVLPTCLIAFAQGYSYADYNVFFTKKCKNVGAGVIMSIASALSSFVSACAIFVWTYWHQTNPTLALGVVLLVMCIISGATFMYALHFIDR